MAGRAATAKPARRAAARSLRRLGVFGGTFDPPHLGHLAIAEWARDRLRLDRVAFVPTGMPPHKRARPRTAARHRLAMTRLAVRGHAAFEVLDLELRRRGPSYTLETLRTLAQPGVHLYMLMGRDSLEEFHTWRSPDEIAALAELVVAGRSPTRANASAAHGAGHPGSVATRRNSARWMRRATWLENPEIDVSSSEIRKWVRAGRSIRYLVPDAVATYIRRHGLYAPRRGSQA